MKVLYFDCFSGAAGDMILGALVDAGASTEAVERNIRALDLHDSSLHFETVTKNGIRATKARVTAGTHSRSSPEITALLAAAPLDDEVRELANRVFDCLVDAEALVHGTSAQTIHLHEAGDDDALIDVVGSCAALLSLRPEMVVTSPLPSGSGFVDTQHGRLPVPVPAVVQILKDVPLVARGDRELVTPTGAAILKTVTDSFEGPPELVVDSIGYGAGDKDDELPNVVRVLIGETVSSRPSRTALLLETNIDDMAPELLPYVIERLMATGAQDAWATPIVMKKHRSAFTLSVLCDAADRDAISDVIYRETTTLGIRIHEVGKDELERAVVTAEVEGHEVRVKLGLRGGRAITASPEYEDAARAARATGMPLKDVYRAATESVRATWSERTG